MSEHVELVDDALLDRTASEDVESHISVPTRWDAKVKRQRSLRMLLGASVGLLALAGAVLTVLRGEGRATSSSTAPAVLGLESAPVGCNIPKWKCTERHYKCATKADGSFAQCVDCSRCVPGLRDTCFESTCSYLDNDLRLAAEEACGRVCEGKPAKKPCGVGPLLPSFSDKRCARKDEAGPTVVLCTGHKDEFFLKFASKEHLGAGDYTISMKALPGAGMATRFYVHNYGEGNRTEAVEFQVFGAKCSKNGTKIWTNYITASSAHEKYIDVPFDACQGYHKYSLEISAESIAWVVGGKTYRHVKLKKEGSLSAAVRSENLQAYVSTSSSNGADSGWSDMGNLKDNKEHFPIAAHFKGLSLPMPSGAESKPDSSDS